MSSSPELIHTWGHVAGGNFQMQLMLEASKQEEQPGYPHGSTIITCALKIREFLSAEAFAWSRGKGTGVWCNNEDTCTPCKTAFELWIHFWFWPLADVHPGSQQAAAQVLWSCHLCGGLPLKYVLLDMAKTQCWLLQAFGEQESRWKMSVSNFKIGENK